MAADRRRDGAVDAYSSATGTSKVKLLGNFGADNFNQKNNDPVAERS